MAAQLSLVSWPAFAYVAVCAIFVALALRRPAAAVAGLILLDPFAFYHYLGPTTLTLSKVALVGTAVGLALRRPSVQVLRNRGALLVAIACASVVAATALSIVQADFVIPAVRETLKAAEYLALFLAALVAFADDRDERLTIGACMAVASVVSLLAIRQEFGGAPAALWVAYHHAVARVAGPLEGPNQLSGYLGLLLPILVVWLIVRPSRWYAWLPVAIVAIADFLTYSRAGVASGFVGVVAALLAVGVRDRHKWLAAIALPLVLGLVAVMLAGGKIAHFWSTQSQLQPEGLGTRRQLWTAAWRLWRAHPFLGIGAGNYELELARAGFPELRTHPNGQFIQALTEGGIPSLLALLWATLQPIWTLWRNRCADPFVAGALGACVGLALHQVLDSMTFFPKVGGMLWILVGIGVAAAVRGAEPHPGA